MAAGVLLIEEAGGKTSAYDTSPLDLSSGKILATNGRLHEAISSELMKLKRLTKF
jgi:myo-inositol-1(or 4)-monophosphatase